VYRQLNKLEIKYANKETENCALKEELKRKDEELLQYKQLLLTLNYYIELTQTLTSKVEGLENKVSELTQQSEEKDRQIAMKDEIIALQDRALYGSRSEKSSAVKQLKKLAEEEQDDNNSDDDDQSPSQPVSVPASQPHKRVKPQAAPKKKKQKKTMKQICEELGIEPKVVLHEIPEEERFCSVCGSPLDLLETRHSKYEINYIPAQIEVIEHQTSVFVCPQCKKDAANSKEASRNYALAPVTSPVPKALLPGTWVSPSFYAGMACAKGQYQIPLHRFAQMLKDTGNYVPSDATLCDWFIRITDKWIRPVYTRLHQHLLSRTHLAADETPLQVINQKKGGTRGYVWQYRTVETDSNPVVMYEYCPGRSGKYAASFLKGFEGVLLVDGYAGYNQVENTTLAHCWVHARRFFAQAIQCSRNEKVQNLAARIIRMIDGIFKIENDLLDQQLNMEDRKRNRQKQTLPLINRLFSLIESIDLDCVVSEKLRKGIKYLLNHEKGLKVFLDDPEVPSHNNRAEEGFVSLARGRHNWLFAYSEEGAQALAMVMTVIKTAQASGLKVYDYIKLLLETLVSFPEGELTDKQLDSVLPWAAEVQAKCALELS
jgi:transposase